MPRTDPVRQDVIRPLLPDALHMKGLLGRRYDANRLNRLHHEEENLLLWPFRDHVPAEIKLVQEKGLTEMIRSSWRLPHPDLTCGDWVGEFIGTWVATAALVARNAGDAELRNKLDALVNEWLRYQQSDGYLGTYDEPDRWKSWDVWVQAHDLLGLLTYHSCCKSEAALSAAVRVADRLLCDFGPARRHLHVGPHAGMASSAVLEPIVWLYWETSDIRYLEFARWLVEDWEAPGGPAIGSSLLAGKGVAGVANAKAAEMLIDFTGLAELTRATGDEQYLHPVLTGWEDIVRHHLYITGSASTGEHFQSDYVLRNDGLFRLGETCVTMTWLYLNLSLGRLTGEARFFDMAEQTLYNHLLGAQSADGRGWAYYMGLRDSKRHRWHTDPDCCPTRGSRALAQMPQHILGITPHGLAVNFFEEAQAIASLNSGLEVQVNMETGYPFSGDVRLSLGLAKPAHFAVQLRRPGWCRHWRLTVNNAPLAAPVDSHGYLVIERHWAPGDVVELVMDMPPRVMIDEGGNNGRAAITRGPLVYAADSAYVPRGSLLDDVILLLNSDQPAAGIRVVQPDDALSPHLVLKTVAKQAHQGNGLWGDKGRYYDLAACDGQRSAQELELVPFFEAGDTAPRSYQDGVWLRQEPAVDVTYQVWLPYVCEE